MRIGIGTGIVGGGVGATRPPNQDDLVQQLARTTDGLLLQDNAAELALDFDGVDQRVYNTSGNIPAGYPFTLKAWFKTADTGTLKYIACLGSNSSNQFHALTLNSSNALTIVASAGSQVISTSALTYTDDNWHYVEGRFLSDTERQIWVGDTVTSIEEVDYAVDLTTSVTYESGILDRFVAGARHAGSFAWHWIGQLKGVAIADGSTDLYNWPFSYGAGLVAADESGNGYDGTIDGATWIATAGTLPVSIGGVANVIFDGSDQQARLLRPFTITGDFSITFMVKMSANGLSNNWLLSNWGGTDAIIYKNGGQFGVRIGGTIRLADSGAGGTLRTLLQDGAFHELTVRRVGSVVYFESEGVSCWNTTTDVTDGDFTDLRFLMNDGGITSKNCSGSLGGVDCSSITDGPHIPCQEVGGDTMYDVSDSANHSLLMGGIITSPENEAPLSAGALVTMRAPRDDGLVSWNGLHGYERLEEDDVVITEYYDDKVFACMVHMDDMYDDGIVTTLRIDNFVNMAEWMSAAKVVAQSGMVSGNNTEQNAWDSAEQTMIDEAGYHHIANHSYNHPNTWTEGDTDAYDLQFAASKDLMLAEIDFPDFWSYKGLSKITSFWQFGDWGSFPYSNPDHADWDYIKTLMVLNNYLTYRHSVTWLGTSYGYPLVWDTDYGMFSDHHMTSNADSIRNSGDGSAVTTYQSHWTHARDNRGWYMVYLHPWNEATFDYFDITGHGVSQATWQAWLDHIKPVSGVQNMDCWYTDQDSFSNYKYLREVNPPRISHEMVGDDFVITVTGDPTARTKYGLSTPLTYKVNKPAGWGSNDADVYYKDTGGYALMTERADTDIFTAENNFRNDGTHRLYLSGSTAKLRLIHAQVSGGSVMPEILIPKKQGGSRLFVPPVADHRVTQRGRGGDIANGCEATYTQTDTTLNSRDDDFWIGTGAPLTKDHADFIARTNGADHQLDQGIVVEVDGIMHITGMALYADTATPDYPHPWTKSL